MNKKQEEKQAIEDFLQSHRIAVVGLSRDPKDFSRAIYSRLVENGYEVFGVNPRAKSEEFITGEGFEPRPFYHSISSIPGDPVDAAFLVTSPEASVSATEECVKHGVHRIWMHRSIGTGSYSPEAEQHAKENGLTVIPRGCVMMHCQPVDGFHGFFRWLMGCPKTEICSRR